MSTTLLIGRCPALSSASCIHCGDSLMWTPLMRLAVYRAHSSGFAISMDANSSMGGPSSGYDRSGSATRSPVMAATSWAMPSTERQSGRLGVTSTSSTASPR